MRHIWSSTPTTGRTRGCGRTTRTIAKHGARARTVRWAAHVLQETPGAFALNGSVESAYQDIEEAWNRSVEDDPIGTLLETQARRLSGTLDAITARPRRVLRTEHRLVKLQSVRRIDAKAVQWLTRQPGRTPAERAGVRQRIKAPRRYEILDTLENRVLRSLLHADVAGRARRGLQTQDDTRRRERIEVHVLRCERLGTNAQTRGSARADRNCAAELRLAVRSALPRDLGRMGGATPTERGTRAPMDVARTNRFCNCLRCGSGAA